MPKEMEANLKREAASKGFKGKRADAYVYGTMRKTGWKPGAKGLNNMVRSQRMGRRGQ